MEKLSNSSHFLDLGGLDNLRVQAQRDEKAALKEVAKQFEGIFIQMLMKSMRDANAVFKADSPFNSETTEFYEQMRDQQMSLDLSNKGMLGLADLMVQQLSPQDSPITPASVLRGNTDNKVNPSMFVNNQSNVPASISLDENIVGASKGTLTSPLVSSPLMSSNGQQELAQILSGQKTVSDLQKSGKALPEQVTQVAKSSIEKKQAATGLGEKVSRFDNPMHFIQTLYPYAQKAAETLGTTPEILIAQSALETGWGQKVIRHQDGTMSNNLFNIKADKRWQGEKARVNTLEFEKGIAVQQRADFRVYDSLEQSFNDFVEFISTNDRYQGAKSVASDPRQFIQALQKAGYATDPHYAKKVINVMKSVSDGVKSFVSMEAK